MASGSEYWECSGKPRFDFEVSFSLSGESDHVTSRGPFQHKLLHYSVNLSQSSPSSIWHQDMEMVLLCPVLAVLPYKDSSTRSLG